MMKFMCIFICAVAAVSASGYGGRRPSYGSAPIGAYAYQVQPALTVKAIIPSYGGQRGYGQIQGGYEAAPIASGYGNADIGNQYGPVSGSRYGGAPPVDREAIALAKLALAAPSAGGPLVWRETPRRVQPAYGPSNYGAPQQRYARAEEAQGASAAAASSSVAGVAKKAYRKSSY
ncbi:chorion protein S18 [Drosophila guanche]|uniref:Blast:Chorion protein S18 n=1 Tax=Drosophila guanche TaxID=7266 RepID=A0A3B0J638_DROGU|nr:chorion protein S18 [Drosophila guanche]SPP77377.1 blast:Chorion protein S18 [Drosophila guanche]